MDLRKLPKRKKLETVQIMKCKCTSAAERRLTVYKSISSVFGPNSAVDGTNRMQNQTYSADVAGTNASCDVLTDDVWLLIFSYLPWESLFVVENVSERWKQLVDVHLKGRRQLTIEYFRLNKLSISDVPKVLDRCGSSLRHLTMRDVNAYNHHENIVTKIGDYCPNLVKLSLLGETVVSAHGLIDVALKCKNLQHLDIRTNRHLSCDELGSLLKLLNQLKRLSLPCLDVQDGDDCFTNIGPMIEDLEFKNIVHLPQSLFLDLSARLKNLQKLVLHFLNPIDLVLDGFAKTCANLKELSITFAIVNDDMLIEISKMLWLQKLDFSYNNRVDDNSVELIVHGRPDLKAFAIAGDTPSQISDAGVKHIVDHCPQLVELDIRGNAKVTDTSLTRVAEYGIIRSLSVRYCRLITDVGCIDLITRCPQLELFDIRDCCNVTGAILLPSFSTVQKRCDEKPLKLMVSGTKITQLTMKKMDKCCLIVELSDDYCILGKYN